MTDPSASTLHQTTSPNGSPSYTPSFSSPKSFSSLSLSLLSSQTSPVNTCSYSQPLSSPASLPSPIQDPSSILVNQVWTPTTNIGSNRDVILRELKEELEQLKLQQQQILNQLYYISSIIQSPYSYYYMPPHPPHPSVSVLPPAPPPPPHPLIDIPPPHPSTSVLPPAPPPPHPSTSVLPPPTTNQHQQEGEISDTALVISPPSCVNDNALDSAAINKAKLIPVAQALEKHKYLITESKASTLAWKIAKDSVFGEEVLKRCTPLGNRELPALPVAEFGELKQIIFKQFPQYWRNTSDFENLWKKCIESVQQGCKRLRLCEKRSNTNYM